MFKVLDITIDPKINSEFVGYQEQLPKEVALLYSMRREIQSPLYQERVCNLFKTPFYAESEGRLQILVFLRAQTSKEILNCKKVGDFHLREVTIAEGSLELNADVELIIDSERRKIVSNHSATHFCTLLLEKFGRER